MEVSLHHIPKVLKIEPDQYTPHHPLYDLPKITSAENFNLRKLELVTG